MMNQLELGSLAGDVARDVGHHWKSLLGFQVVYTFLETWILVPAVALSLSALLSQAGHEAVTNRDVLDFFLSSLGLVYAGVFGLVAMTLLLVQQAGLMIVAAVSGTSKFHPGRKAFLTLAHQFGKVIGLGAIKLILLTLAATPFLVLAGVVYWMLLSNHDINYYLDVRPPRFWFAAAMGAGLAIAAATVGIWLLIRWALALPILLFENQNAIAALRTSRVRVRGAQWKIAAILVGWQAGALLLGIGLHAGFRRLAAEVLKNAGERPIVQIAILLGLQGVLFAAASVVAVMGQALITRRIYLCLSRQPGTVLTEIPESISGESTPSPTWSRRFLVVRILIWLVAPLVMWADLSRQLKAHEPVKVTAHRGHSLAAPENTLSAIRKAIESGADYAEIDVQQTADGVVVLLHDTDLKRVAGVSAKLEDLSYEKVRTLDVGRWFAPSFAGERIPTLVEAINLARGRLRLNIELKVSGSDRRLAQEVARIVEEQNFESDCVITSFNYNVLKEIKQQNPRLRDGLIVATALGDVSLLNLDALSVRADWLTDAILRSAHRADMEVHVWTVNKAAEMTGFVKRGVDNIITDDPEMLIRVRDEWVSLTRTERLVLASRLLLGLNP